MPQLESSPEAPVGVDWPVGHVIDGKYEVKALIGKGGMGSVYRVRHWGWNLDLAVKVPLAHLVSDRVNKERFILEAHTWIDLGVHPNIVQCWFVRELEGVPLVFLDYLSGGSLKEWRLDGLVQPGQWAQILDLMIQACDGVAHAHEHGLVHRDIKPANLLLRDDQRLCVTDFGLVKVTQLETPVVGPEESALAPSLPDDLEEGASVSLRQDSDSGSGSLSSLTLTKTGSLLGTPEYGAPEQWLQARSVGIGADIYALGGVLFELCCGRRPFDDGKRKVNSSILLGRHLSKPAPDPRSFNPEVPEALSEVILHCLAKKAEDRPPSTLALRENLERVYRDVVGHPYPRPVPRAGVQRADALNSKALSLWNLGMRQKAFDAWREASKLDALHPESVYNRSILQWRLGQIEHSEVLRRLTQVKAAYPHAAAYLGYLHLERLCPLEARRELEEALELPLAAHDGTIWRALGDANMALEDYDAAVDAYREALQRIPDDKGTRACLQMATIGVRAQGEKLLFPLSQPRLVLERPGRVTALAITEDSRFALSAAEDRLEMWDLLGGATRWIWQKDHVDDGSSIMARLGVTAQYALSLDTPKGRVWSLDTGQMLTELEGRKRFYAMVPGQEAAVAGLEALEVVSLPKAESLLTYRGHTKPVYAVAVSPDGSRALSGGGDRVVRLWDLANGETLGVMEGHTDVVEALAMTPDGTLGLSGGRDRTVRVWLLATGECLRVLGEHPHEVRRLRLTSDGRYVAVLSWSAPGESSLDIWDVATGDRVFHRAGVSCATAIPGGPWILAGSGPGQLKLWEVPAGRAVRNLEGHTAPVQALAASLDGRWGVSASEDGRMQVWELAQGTRFAEAPLAINRAHTHTEAESSQELFLTHMDRALERRKAGDPSGAYLQMTQARQVPGYIRDPGALALNAELLSSLPRKSLRSVWELRNCLEFAGGQLRVAISRDGAFAVSSAAKLLHLWELSTGSCLRGFAGHSDTIRCLALSGDATRVVSGSQDGSLRLWDLRNGECLKVLKSHEDGPAALAVNGDGDLLMSVGRGEIHILDLISGEMLHNVRCEKVSSLAMTPDGRLGLTGGDGLRLWDLSRGQCVRFLDVLGGAATSSVALASDGKYALAGGEDHTLRLWSLEDGRCVSELAGHTDRIQRVSLTKDGRIALSAGRDGSLRIWDVAAGACLEVIEGQGVPLTDLDMTPEGRFAMTAGEDQLLRLWELDWELGVGAHALSLSEALRKVGLLDRITSLFRRRGRKSAGTSPTSAP